MKKVNSRRVLAAIALSVASAGCSYGKVTDAESRTAVGGAQVSFQRPDLGGALVADLATKLGAPISAKTWSATDPGAGSGAGSYYLNPYGTFAVDDPERPLFVSQGWQRISVSKAGYDTRIFYRQHTYEECTVAEAQGPYSAGPYPYVSPTATPSVTSATKCALQSFTLHKSTENYIREADMIVDVRPLRDYGVTTDCDGHADRCVRVSVGTANVGDGDLWLRGNSNVAGVSQRRFRRDGSIVETALPNAVFLFHGTHGHIHLQNWTQLRLRTRSASCSTDATASQCPVVGVPGQKISFCLMETDTFDSSFTPNPARARSCGFNAATGEINQGIGAGKEDVYDRSIEGQTIGIDGLAPGTYWLEVEVNPANQNGQRTVLESNYSNNITRLPITI